MYRQMRKSRLGNKLTSESYILRKTCIFLNPWNKKSIQGLENLFQHLIRKKLSKFRHQTSTDKIQSTSRSTKRNQRSQICPPNKTNSIKIYLARLPEKNASGLKCDRESHSILILINRVRKNRRASGKMLRVNRSRTRIAHPPVLARQIIIRSLSINTRPKIIMKR